ncbi:MAG TPA: trehalose-phosphatase [Sphingomicrobium sp.]|nr:trehalose-phosphatase [Sphingomicrobium sp.]
MTRNSDAAVSRRPPIELLNEASLFLDFDGTLVDIAPRPDEVLVSLELRQLLEQLRERLDGRLILLTGRSAAEVEKLLHPLSLSIGGHHGAEMRDGGRSAPVERPGLLDELAKELRRLEQDHPGVQVEEKPLGIALHYRQAPDAEEACRDAVERAAERSGLAVQPGKMVFELKRSGVDKGTALQALMMRPAFSGTTPVFLGDDLTDESALRAAQELGGSGIIVGDRTPTAARYRLQSVADALAWLSEACEAIR